MPLKYRTQGSKILIDQTEYKHRLNGAFLEGLMGLRWSIEKRVGWKDMMKVYHSAMAGTLPPHIVAFNVWGNPTDYQFFRYAFTSHLLNDGYFSFTNRKRGYSGAPWFDEYDLLLGKAVEPPQHHPDKEQYYRRRFENAIVYVNPTWKTLRIDMPAGYRRFRGKQDPEVNNGSSKSPLLLRSKDGIILVKVTDQ